MAFVDFSLNNRYIFLKRVNYVIRMFVRIISKQTTQFNYQKFVKGGFFKEYYVNLKLN